MSDESLTPDGGVIRLFPLPNLVLFPGAVQPLHIFEPRYRQMTADALAGDRLIALVLPRPGWEPHDAGTPALHPVACVGRILAEQSLADGRYNILLRGLRRVRIQEEMPQPQLYRVAQVEVLDEISCPDEADGRARLREQAAHWFESQSELRDRFVELIDGQLGLGALVDLVTFALPLDAEFKQTLLEELDVARRLEALLRHLGGPRRGFPPDFSAN
jgi:Lon protease-like protein